MGIGLAVAAIVVPLVAASGGSSSPAGGPANLKVDSLIVRDFKLDTNLPQTHLEVLLHNLGGTRAVLVAATVRVEDVYELPRCASQDDIPLSHTYGLVLPHRAPQVLRVPLHDDVGPDDVDRFAISFSTEPAAHERATYYLFRVALSVEDDTQDGSRPVGTALIALPFVPNQGEYYWSKETEKLLSTYEAGPGGLVRLFGPSMPCWKSNTRVLRQAFAKPAVRSDAVNEVARELVTPSFASLR